MEDLKVATVLKPQGIRGEIKVKTYTDSVEDFEDYKTLYIDGVVYKMLKVRPDGIDCAILTLRGLSDRNAAELLRGKDVLVRREDAPELPEDTWYIVDLIGCTVQDELGAIYGTVTEVIPAASAVFVFENTKGKSQMFVNADGVLADVDLAQKVIFVNKARFEQVVVE